MKHTYYFSIVDIGHGDRIEFKTRWPICGERSYKTTVDFAAHDAAKSYHEDHNGREVWNGGVRTIELYATKDGPAVALVDVEIEFEPTFYAMEID